MKQTIGFNQFCDAFPDTYKNNFTYAGKRALYDYLEEYEESTGEDVELDTIALCCEYTEYDSALDCIKDAGYNFTPDEDETEDEQEASARAWLEDRTQVIDVPALGMASVEGAHSGGGIIILDF